MSRAPTLLLVDDVPANLVALESILDNQGYELIQVTSGAAAIDAVEKHELAVILMDVNMPIMDGIEAVRRIRQLPRGKDVAVLYVTAASHDNERVRAAYSAGAADFISKPIDRDILRAKVKVFVDQYQSRTHERAETNRLTVRLQDAAQLNEEFIVSLERELRTPLSSIAAWARGLRTGTLPDAQRIDTLAMIERTADAQLVLVQEMLDISRLASGTLTTSPVSLDIGRLVEDAVAMLQSHASEAGVRLEARVSPDLPRVQADPERISQTVRELVNISIQESGRGGLSVVSVTREGGHIRLTVTDSGAGLPSDVLATMFDAYDDTVGPESLRGSAMKLAILKRVAELHHGTITAELAGLGAGTRFVMTLPVA